MGSRWSSACLGDRGTTSVPLGSKWTETPHSLYPKRMNWYLGSPGRMSVRYPHQHGGNRKEPQNRDPMDTQV